MKMKKPIPRFVIIIIAIALIGLSMRFIKPGIDLLAKTTENEITIPRSRTESSSSNDTDKLIINALLKMKDGLDSASNGKFVSSYKSSNNRASQNGNFTNYQVIIKDNLFRALGTEEPVETKPVVQEAIAPSRPQTRPDPPGEIKLTGIVRLGDKTMALMEDVSAKKSYFLGAGDNLRNYTIESVNEQSVSLINNGSRTECKLGGKVYYSREGVSQATGFINEQKYESVAPSGGNSSPSPTESSSNLSIIEQMRARRMKELGK